MRTIRFVTTALAAGALIVAAGCKSTTSTTTTSTTPATTVSSTDNGTTSYGTTTTSNTTTTSTTSLADNGTTTVTTPATVTTPSTVTNPDGSTTTVLPNGNTVTRATTTTVVYPNGTVQSMPSDGSTTVTTANGTVPAVPPGAAIVTKTTTTISTQPGASQIAQTVPQPIYITTTPANVYAQQPPMTSSSTTIYQPYRSGRGRRFPGFNLLVFADRASFSSNNSSLNGTVNTGQFGSDIRNESGWGAGFNTYLGRTNFSTEFTYSNIQPRATLTPANTAFQPITNFRFKMQPITGTLQLHFNPRSSVDAYIGGGGAYVMFRPSNSFNAGTTGLTGVNFRNEWGPLVNAGIGFGFSPNFGLNFDAKYMWVRANATPTFNNVTIGNVGNSSRLGVNPFVVSAGLRFGF